MEPPKYNYTISKGKNFFENMVTVQSEDYKKYYGNFECYGRILGIIKNLLGEAIKTEVNGRTLYIKKSEFNRLINEFDHKPIDTQSVVSNVRQAIAQKKEQHITDYADIIKSRGEELSDLIKLTLKMFNSNNKKE